MELWSLHSCSVYCSILWVKQHDHHCGCVLLFLMDVLFFLFVLFFPGGRWMLCSVLNGSRTLIVNDHSLPGRKLLFSVVAGWCSSGFKPLVCSASLTFVYNSSAGQEPGSGVWFKQQGLRATHQGSWVRCLIPESGDHPEHKGQCQTWVVALAFREPALCGHVEQKWVRRWKGSGIYGSFPPAVSGSFSIRSEEPVSPQAPSRKSKISSF